MMRRHVILLSIGALGLSLAAAAFLFLLFIPHVEDQIVRIPTPPLPDYAALLRESDDPFFGTSQMKEHEDMVRLNARDHFARIALAQDYMRFGRYQEAIDLLESEEENAALHEALGIAYLKLAEVQNCVQHHNRESCIFPLAGQGVHHRSEAAVKARRHLEAVVKTAPGNLRAVWLLNVAYMMMGAWPENAPEKYRLPSRLFRSSEAFSRFVDVAPELGLDVLDLAGGCAMEDFDNDGDLDILTTTSDPAGAAKYFRNDKGRFVGRDIAGQTGGLNLVTADYDNDGFIDVLILRGGWMGRNGKQRNSLLRNNGNGTFTDATTHAGLAEPAFPTQTAAWADYDGDGDLDLYIGNESHPSQLFKNNGDGTFQDVAPAAGVENHRYAKAVTWGDYDNDGDPDLYVSNYNDRNRLYRNKGDGTFADVAADLGVDRPWASFPCWFWDFDNDGRLDLYVASYFPGAEITCADYLGRPLPMDSDRLYRNTGDGFKDVTTGMGLNHVHPVMGSNYGDFDNDGWSDFYLGTGWPGYDSLVPNLAYHNSGGRRFNDVTTAGGFGHLQKGHGVAFGDIDGDGDQDIAMQVGGFYPGDAFANVLYRNPGFGNHWITLRLRGTTSNHFGVGARITVHLHDRKIHRVVSTGGSFGCNSLQQEIGLGNAKRILKLEIVWPATGRKQVLNDLEVDRVHVVREP